MTQSRRSPSLLPVLCIAGALPGCSLIRSVPAKLMSPVLDGISTSLYKQTDLQLAKDGLPTFLLMIDGLLESSPNNEQLLLTGTQAYSAYAMAFVEDDDPERALGMYRKAMGYALRALWPSMTLTKLQEQPQEQFEAAIAKVKHRDGPALFWTASCWASWIVMNAGSVDALADLPRVQLMMERSLAIDETYQHGGPHLFMGVYHAARPKQIGGNPEKAKEHFDRAVEIAGDNYLIAKVYFAKYYARQVFDKALHDTALKEVLNAEIDEESDLALLNTIAKARAAKLLEESDEFF